jgi:hypothetical protein
MWLSLLLLVLIIAITMIYSMQGVYSALIMAVLTICCASLAIGSYDYVAMEYVAPNFKPAFAHAGAMALLFAVPLLVLRLIADSVLKRSPLLPTMVDKVGGAAVGLVIGLVTTGMIGLITQLIPFGFGAFGYARIPVVLIDDAQDEEGNIAEPTPLDFDENELWLSPDRFAANVAGLMSDGLFSGKRSLNAENPDMVQAIGWMMASSPHIYRYAPPGSISIVKTPDGHDTAIVDLIYDMIPANIRTRDAATMEPVEPGSGNEFRVVRVKLGNKARDSKKNHIFTLRQFRLVGENETTGKPLQVFAKATQEPFPDNKDAPLPTVNRHVQRQKRWAKWWPFVDQPMRPRRDHDSEVELVFEVPRSFNPWYLEYKRGARVSVSFEGASETSTASSPPSENRDSDSAMADSSGSGTTVPSRSRAGRVRGATTRSGQSFFGDEMPITMRNYQRLGDAEVSRGVFIQGHLVGNFHEQEEGRERQAKTFSVPSDKRLLHLNVENLRARSMYGRAREFAVKNIQNYRVMDDSGREYRVCGKYAIAEVNGEVIVEIQYYPNQAGSIGGLGKFSKIKENDLEEDYDLVFLFLVEPGARIVRFQTGASADRADELEAENLVAPN